MIAFLQSRSRGRLLPWCCVVLAGFLLWISSLAAEEPASILTRAQWDEIWRRIGQVDHLRATDTTDMGNREDLWGRGLPNPDLMSCLWKASQTSKAELKHIINEAVEQFGQSDAVDFRVFVSAWPLLTPLKRYEAGTDDPNPEYHNWLCATVAETQVRNWCQHPENIERIVWFCAWGRWFSSNRPASSRHPERLVWLANELEKDFQRTDIKADDGNYYWQCARTFAFLACATNRSDLFARRNPSELRPQFETWLEWFRKTCKSHRLRASHLSPTWIGSPEPIPPAVHDDAADFPELVVIPKTPFAEWHDLAMPPAPRWFREVTGE